jgi:outer membrane protein OmpA-like peptidoglycan-associated protein
VWAKGNSLLGGPTLLTIHVLGTALVIGLIFIIHLRLLGVFDGIAYTSLRRLFPALWVGFAVQLVSGALLWVTKATQYTVDVAFLVKLVLVAAGFILALILYSAVKREAVSWAADTAAPRRFEAVLPSLVVWCAVLVFARLTAFLGALPDGTKVVQETRPTVVTEMKPVIVEERKPPVVAEAKPVIVEEAKPPVVMEAKPVIVEEAKPPVVTEAKPVIVEEAKPPVVTEAKPVIVEEAKPPVITEAKPVIVEESKPIITGADRKIVQEGGLQIIHHDPVNRFRVNAKEVNVEHRDNITITVVLQQDGSRVVTEVDETGRLLRRIRRDDAGHDVVLIDNTRGPGAGGLVLDLQRPVVTIAPELYVRDAAGATAEDIALTLAAPPVDHIERRYTLEEIIYNEPLRARMSRIDIDTIRFDTGSSEIAPEQAERLALVAQGMLNAIKTNPGEMFLVEGYTDAVGSDSSNLSLSDRRAESVAVMLTGHFGVPAENLTTQGYGKQFLKIPTNGPERANRRVAVRRITPLLNGGQN